MGRLHIFDALWRHTSWSEGFGEQLRKLNRNWIIKNHTYRDFIDYN